MTRRVFATAALAAVVLSVALPAQQRPYAPVTDAMLRNPSPNDWLTWRGTYRSQGYSALNQITRGNVKNLQLAWAWAMEPGLQEPAPVVHDGVMFLPNPGGTVQALDAATGDLLWQYKHEFADGQPSNRMMRGLSIYEDKVYLNTPDARIVALDARTGDVVWNVQVADPAKGFSYNTGSLIVKGKVISGLSGCTQYIEEKCALTAHDAKTGKELWRTHTITKPGEPGSETWDNIEWIYRVGGGMWIPGSYDSELDVIFWSTSQAKPWARAARGNNDLGLYTNALLAIHPETGKILWYVQPLPGESHDLDEVFESVLVDISPQRKSIFKMGKIGIMWEIDRKSGKIVRASDLGYQNLVDVNPQTGKVEYRAGMIPELGKMIHMCPSVSGIRNWPAMAYSPETQAFYIPTQLTCSDMTFIASEDRRPGGSGNGYGPRKDYFHPQAEGKNLGQLVAMHADGHVLWKQPQRSGLTSAALTTAGGVVFYGDWNRYIYARDVKTGDLLWQTRAPASAQGYPISYSVRGRQYIAFPSGIGALAGWFNANPTLLTPELKRPTQGNSMLVFALPQ